MTKNINYDYWRTKEILTFDVDKFINGICAKYQQMAKESPDANKWVKSYDELRTLWDKVMEMPVKGDASLYPGDDEPQPAMTDVWLKAGDFWRAGFRKGDSLICDQHGIPLRRWMIRVIKTANGEKLEIDESLINFTAIDVETATRKRSSICEIGIAVFTNGEVTEKKSWFVQPPGNIYEDANIDIHHIRPEDTADSPTFAEVWKEVAPYLEGKLVIAHNTAFDMYALRDAFNEFNIPYPSFQHICSCRLAKRIIPGLYNYRLPTVSSAIGFHMESHHRAGVDAEAAAMIFMACIEKSDCLTLEELQSSYKFRCGEFNDAAFMPQRSTMAASKPKTKDIFGDPDLIDEGNYFYGKEVCFTGTCVFGTREWMLQMVANVGGIPAKGVTKRTQVLVVGQQDYAVVGADGMSSKQRKAMQLRDAGQDIEILSEAEFLQMI